MIRNILVTILFLIFCNPCYGALVNGTNCGFVTSAPVDDPSGSTAQIDAKYRIAKFTSPADATAITEIGMYIDNATEAADMDLGVYSHNAVDNQPNVLLTAASTIAKGTDAGWKKATGLNIPISGNTVYWLGGQCDNTATTTNFNYTSTGTDSNKYPAGTATALPDPYVAVSSSTVLVGIYAVYTTATASVGQVIITSTE